MADTRLIQSRYRLLEIIGRGGMGEVWRALDESLGRQVAVKCLKPMGPQHDQAFTRILRERFRREARVAASLQHRGVTVVHDFGEYEGVLYLVMELLDGQNLSQLLEENQQHPLPVEHVVDIAEQVADALGYTHRQGIVHRDLKPANIMRLTDGTVKICDFGIARLGHDIGMTSRLTTTGLAMGTPHYMSPEQISGKEVDHRSDLYSLGCVLYEIATGVPPFDQEDAWAVLVGHRDTPPEPLRTHRAELPGFFDRVVLDLLAKAPEERPVDAGDLRRRIILGRTGEQPALGPGSLAHPGPGLLPAPRERALPSWTRSMTAGHRATGATGPHAERPDPAAGLTGQWTTARATAPHTNAFVSVSAGPPAPDLLAGLEGRHSAGIDLGRLGRWEEAGEVHRQVAEQRGRVLGPDHPDTLASHYEIGLTLSRTGRAEEALSAFTRVAEGRERALGADHPHTLAARQATAHSLGRLGRHAEAHQVYETVLAVRERVMGPDHPDTLRCRHNLAFNLCRLGRPEESCRIAGEVADARARVLGPTHPDTLATRYEVAYTLGRLGRWTEALATYQDVARARADVLGADHPDTFAARYEAGISLGRLGHDTQALELYRSLVADRTRTAGAADPETLRARHGLGVNLGRLGRWEEALTEAREVCALRERALGPDHPDTVISRREVAAGLGWLGRWSEALVAYRQVAEARTRTLGPDHPQTLAARDDEAHCLERLAQA
ncbi:serine/threonine-protein kinase [Streptomyces rubiginosohelvolus]|uniref:non-specific serine/threonine protein kinase n=1 Tax=Streptomyces rubiginosohelvolus TaxID=67362 RepID=A0ABQ3BXV4_9ACTN|nr:MULTISPECIES: serine/threonine-protein kinase [Streptomyces]GGS18317.1 serine/threonine protein kinase [Streptomyces rubiginosohelvolus]GGZ60963.1 serine/threonine protein kinase [Streptomyces pluricolorescens]